VGRAHNDVIIDEQQLLCQSVFRTVAQGICPRHGVLRGGMSHFPQLAGQFVVLGDTMSSLILRAAARPLFLFLLT